MSGETIDRAAIAAETWGTAPDSSAEAQPVEAVGTPTEVVEEPKVEKDPWEGVPTALKEEVIGLRTKVAGLDDMSFRLKQTESRLGGVLNDLHAAKEAAKTVSKAPTKEQIDRAASDQGEWDALKEDFPEWTKATDARIAAERAEILRLIPDAQAIREEMKTAQGTELEKLKTEFSETLVSMRHPDWKTVQATEEFKKWHEQVGGKNSFNPLEVAAIFDEFKEYQTKHKSSATIQAERKQRLELSQTTPGHNLPPVKSQADMSASELRASIAKQVWGK